MFKLNDKIKLVIVINEILKVTEENKYSLCQKNGGIYVYNGSYWQSIDENDFKKFLGNAAEKIGVDIVESRYFQFKDNLYKQFHSSASLERMRASFRA